MKKITRKIYKEMVGVEPMHDDLERCNCKKAGEVGHWSCGICDACNKPRFICGHLNKTNKTMKLGSCDNLISEGISYTCKNIKVYCKDCNWNDRVHCEKQKDLNGEGKCIFYKTKTNFINKLTKKLWK